jgi:hypothetical protein
VLFGTTSPDALQLTFNAMRCFQEYENVSSNHHSILEHVDEADELGYKLLWQGEPENL